MKYTQLKGTKIYEYAVQQYTTNNLPYHNLNHIEKMYAWLDANAPYVPEIDVAVLLHDVVYDDKPDKELRSAQKVHLSDMRVETRLTAAALVEDTQYHIVRGGSWSHYVIYADLHELADPESALHNYNLLLQESKQLYIVDTQQFAAANLNYMNQLQQSLYANIEAGYDYTDILPGIELTKNISRALL